MLPCVCSVIDHRRRQNVVRTSVTHSAIVLYATLLFLPHFDVTCDLLLNRRTTTWNLFVKLIITSHVRQSYLIPIEPSWTKSLCARPCSIKWLLQFHFSCKTSITFSASSCYLSFGNVKIILNNPNPTLHLWLLPNWDVCLNLSILSFFIYVFFEYS